MYHYKKLTRMAGTVALSITVVCGFLTPSAVLANYMYEFEFIGDAGGVVTGGFEIDTNTGTVDENNLMQIFVNSATGIGGSGAFSIPTTNVVQDFGFDADAELITSLDIPDAVNDFQCGSGADTLCDVQMQVTTTVIFNEGIEEQTVRAVPEPTTLALMGLGLAGIGFARKKKKN